MKRVGILLVAILGLIAASCGSHEPCPSFQGSADQPDVEQRV